MFYTSFFFKFVLTKIIFKTRKKNVFGLQIFFILRNCNKLSIKNKSYRKSTKINAFEQKICICRSLVHYHPNSNGSFPFTMHSKHFKWLNPGIQQNIVRLGRYFCIRLGLSFIETLFQKSFLVFFTAFIGRELNHFIFFYYIYYFFYDIYIGCSMLVFVNFFFLYRSS